MFEKLHSGMSYNTMGREVNVNESIIQDTLESATGTRTAMTLWKSGYIGGFIR